MFFHIVDNLAYKRALANVYSLLKDDGIFIMSENFLRHKTEKPTEHILNRTKTDIEQMLTDEGFQIIKRVPMFALMNFPVDTSSYIRKSIWGFIFDLTRRNEKFGYFLGAILYPIEILLTSICSESSSTEIVVCNKLAFENMHQRLLFFF